MSDKKLKYGSVDSEGPVRLLLVEDDAMLSSEIMRALQEHGFEVSREETGTKALERARNENFKLMVVDRLLPELDGLTLIETLRSEGNVTPLLVLSALSAVDDRISGLKAGGDDYLTKPFVMEELIARLEALLRRPVEERVSILQIGPLKMDLIERKVWRDEEEIELLPREFRLLEYMMRRPNTVLTRTMLLEDVWNYRHIPQTNLVDVHVGKLRRKVDGNLEPALIESIRGSGFCLRVPG